MPPRSAPESIESYYARLRAACDGHGVLRARDTADIAGWQLFPYEPESLRLKPLQDLDESEPARRGEEPATCWCANPRTAREGDPGVIWSNARWMLRLADDHGMPFLGILVPYEHHDLADLPAGLAGEWGVLVATLAAAVESLPSVGRCHVSKWGDGSAHLHTFVMGRPTRIKQFRGTCWPIWDDVLPRMPQEVLRDNAAHVVDQLCQRVGGDPLGSV